METTSAYMTIATADADGTPWATPVWFAPVGDDALLWVSDPAARHSRNIAVRPRVAIVVFDSRVTPADAAGLYLTADAGLADPLAVVAFSRASVAQGLAAWGVPDVTGAARHRLYRAVIRGRWALGPGDRRVPLGRATPTGTTARTGSPGRRTRAPRVPPRRRRMR